MCVCVCECECVCVCVCVCVCGVSDLGEGHPGGCKTEAGIRF